MFNDDYGRRPGLYFYNKDGLRCADFSVSYDGKHTMIRMGSTDDTDHDFIHLEQFDKNSTIMLSGSNHVNTIILGDNPTKSYLNFYDRNSVLRAALSITNEMPSLTYTTKMEFFEQHLEAPKLKL